MGAAGDDGGARHLWGQFCFSRCSPVTPSRIRGLDLQPGGLASPRRMGLPSFPTKTKHFHPGTEKPSTTRSACELPPARSHAAGAEAGSGTAPSLLSPGSGREPALLQRLPWGQRDPLTALTRLRRTIFLGGMCVSSAGLPWLFHKRHTRTERLQERRENQQDRKGTCPLTPNPIQGRRQESRKGEGRLVSKSPSKFPHAEDTARSKAEKWKRTGGKKRKIFIVT